MNVKATRVTVNVTGPLVRLDDRGKPTGTFDVFDHLTKVGPWTYIDRLIR